MIRKNNQDTKEIDIEDVKKSNDTYEKKYKSYRTFYDINFFNNKYNCPFI